MTKRLLGIMLLSTAQLYAHGGAYVKAGKTSIAIGNASIERIIGISPNGVSTSRIVNRISGSVYDVKSVEFALNVVLSGTGPAYSKQQNGENPVILTSNDCEYKGYKIEDLADNGKELVLQFTFKNDVTALTANVVYDVSPNTAYMRKRIDICDSSYGIQFVDRVVLESMTFTEKDFSHGQFGQPVFNKDMFCGVEYPTGENTIASGKVMMGYVVGQNLTKTVYKSHPSVVGVASSSATLEQAFMTYVEQIKPKRTRPFLLYNSWYDLRRPVLVRDSESVMNEENVLRTIQAFRKYSAKYNIKLDAFVLDEGWDNFQSVWRIDSTRFPGGFTRIASALDSMNTSLGLWASPWGGYEFRDRRTEWARENGYETTGDFLCFAGTKYKAAMQNAMVKYAQQYNVGYFKWDGFLLACNELDHGHLPGMYSREAFVATYIDMMKAVRITNPDIYLNITSGTWLSPWWLNYADCIWMQGADYAYAEDVPCINERDKAITYKDEVLWDDFRRQRLLFPMSSLMTHGIIQGRLNLLGGKDESVSSFCNEVMMYFGRGVMMWELYVSPDALSESDWNAIASSVKWAGANKDVLAKTKMILGDPVRREVYGYVHLTKDKGILLLRNPNVEEQEARIRLTPDLGAIDPSAKYFIKIVYPYNMILPTPVGIGQDLRLHLDGYEVLTAELVRSDNINKNLPVNIRFSTHEDHLAVYGRGGKRERVVSVDSRNLGEVSFEGPTNRIGFSEHGHAVISGKVFGSHLGITIPSDCRNPRFGFLLEPSTRLQHDVGPHMDIKVNGVSRKLEVEEENGRWFWVLADLQVGENDVRVTINFGKKAGGKISSWIFADEKLSGIQITNIAAATEDTLPARPYPENIQKLILPINTYKL